MELTRFRGHLILGGGKGVHNGRQHRYPPEFRRKIVELVRAGSPEKLAEEFEPSQQTIRNWVKQADLDEGVRTDGLTSAEREELTRLRREVKQLKLEHEILSKAAAWFARETDSIPPKSSNSSSFHRTGKLFDIGRLHHPILLFPRNLLAKF
ncbi:MAG: transposase [Gemmatimonadota bacterium]